MKRGCKHVEIVVKKMQCLISLWSHVILIWLVTWRSHVTVTVHRYVDGWYIGYWITNSRLETTFGCFSQPYWINVKCFSTFQGCLWAYACTPILLHSWAKNNERFFLSCQSYDATATSGAPLSQIYTSLPSKSKQQQRWSNPSSGSSGTSKTVPSRSEWLPQQLHVTVSWHTKSYLLLSPLTRTQTRWSLRLLLDWIVTGNS